MIKRIKVEQLRVGMFIHDLNCGWAEHPFLRNRFPLKQGEDLEKIRAIGLQEIYIDSSKGLDVEGGQSEAEINAALHQKMLELATKTLDSLPRVSHKEAMEAARGVHKEANAVVFSILNDARLGHQIEVERLTPVVERMTQSILENEGALISLCRIKQRDQYTFQHSVSVCALLVSFSNALHLSADTVRDSGTGGLLHDIGKMMVPDAILNKPGKLTDEEFSTMKTHVQLGTEILRITPNISETVIRVVSQHHERFEGTGYPKGLKGDAISQLGQMASIVDVYDALTSDRVYHKGMEPPEVLRKMFEWAPNHFDEALVQHFIRILGIYPVGTLVKLESGRLAVVLEVPRENTLRPLVRLCFDTRKKVPLVPRDLDLGSKEGSTETITGYETPSAWGLNPRKLLGV